jgi:hypothetical protein
VQATKEMDNGEGKETKNGWKEGKRSTSKMKEFTT